ncbi:MAG: c-type cytochrome, partial [Gimesia chilikensis]
ASTDTRFRPVQFANGPDGNLYVIDMNRDLIEGAMFLPPELLKKVNVNGGDQRGRIYRIVRENFEQSPLPQLGKATTAELVRLLAHRNGWHRDTAARLIYERQDRSAVPLLKHLAVESDYPVARMTALYALEGLETLDEASLLRALKDDVPEVRVHALRLAEQRVQDSKAVRDQLLAMGEDPALKVLYQLAFSLGELKPSTERNAVLASLAMRDGQNQWMELAILSSLAEGAGTVFQRLARDEAYRQSKMGTRMLTALARQTGAAGRPQEMEIVLNSLLPWSAAEEQQAAVLLTLLAAQPEKMRRTFLNRHQASLKPIMGRVLKEAREVALDTRLPVKQRLTAIERLGFAPYAKVRDVFSQLLEPQQVNPVQVAAIVQLGQFPDQEIAALLISGWPKMTPDLRTKAAETLLSRAAWSGALIDAIEAGSIGRGDLSPARVDLLKQHPDKRLASRVKQLYADRSLARRDEVVQQYQSALKTDGDVDSGKGVFKKVCSACHRLEGVGTAVGADLKAIRDRGKAGVLLHILDPNREVKPQYMSYTLVLESGQVLSGMIADESVNSITVRKPDGTSTTVLRINIEEIRSSGLSFMPEGLEKQIDQRAMADLLAYLMSLQADGADASN